MGVCLRRARLFEKEARVQTLWQRRAALLRKEKYKEIPELVQVMEMLEKGKFAKMVAFTYSEAGKKVRTNNHVERLNRWLRFGRNCGTSGGGGSGCSASSCWRWTDGGRGGPRQGQHRAFRCNRAKDRFVLLGLDRWWQEVARDKGSTERSAATERRTG